MTVLKEEDMGFWPSFTVDSCVFQQNPITQTPIITP